MTWPKMAILDPGDLLSQARRLIGQPSVGPPRQVDIRRAISSAYYSVFHFVLTALADEFVGKTYRSSSRYAYVYRSLDHARLVAVCKQTRKLKPDAGLDDDLRGYPFGEEVREFAELAIALQDARNRADYDPARRFKTVYAQWEIGNADNAMRCFGAASDNDRKAFLTLLLCKGR